MKISVWKGLLTVDWKVSNNLKAAELFKIFNILAKQNIIKHALEK